MNQAIKPGVQYSMEGEEVTDFCFDKVNNSITQVSSAEERSFSPIPGIARFPSPGHDSDISSYCGSPSILHLPALHLSGDITTPPPRATLGKRPAAAAPRSLWQEKEDQVLMIHQKTFYRVFFFTGPPLKILSPKSC